MPIPHKNSNTSFSFALPTNATKCNFVGPSKTPKKHREPKPANIFGVQPTNPSIFTRSSNGSIFDQTKTSEGIQFPAFLNCGAPSPNNDLSSTAPFAAVAPTARANTNNYVPNEKKLPYELAIIDSSRPSGRTTTNQQRLIQDAFESALIAHILTTENAERPVFQFELGQFEGGVFKMTLHNEDDVTALKKLVNALPKLWPDFKPQVVPVSDIPPLQKVNFYIEDGVMSKQPVKTILCMLGKQNSGLNVHQWEFEERVDTDKGLKLTVGIDSDTQTTLENDDSKKLYLLYGMITFSLVDDKAVVDGERIEKDAEVAFDLDKKQTQKTDII